MTFEEFFENATGKAPFPYQIRLAKTEDFPDVLEAPTGTGKTAAVILAWLWRRLRADETIRNNTPRRLIYCLPMRSLVTQTANCAKTWFTALGVDPKSVHLMMGGAVAKRWEEEPEQDQLIIGTQDQLLSRAMNRGYAMSRFKWPVHFALLNNDVLWAFDEVQLMGVGLSTSAQLQAFRYRTGSFGPTKSLWMSATLDEGQLKTVDLRGYPLQRHGLSDLDRAQPVVAQRLTAVKTIHKLELPCAADDKNYAAELAKIVSAKHVPGTRTLVVMNRVERAQQLAKKLSTTGTPTRLLHSRYRPSDRKQTEEEVFAATWTGILVATQTVEAGVDISCKVLFTELAPWPSLVQRFGRCNRGGEFPASDPAQVYWIDLPDKDSTALPYELADLQTARQLLHQHQDVGPTSLTADLGTSRPTLPVLREKDLLELFDTTPDLNGLDLDVSRYIRTEDSADVQIAWRTWTGSDQGVAPPDGSAALHRDELCSVGIGNLKKILAKDKSGTTSDEPSDDVQSNDDDQPGKADEPNKDDKPSKTKAIGKAAPCWQWNSLEGLWEQTSANHLMPGRSYLVPVRFGCYSAELGWTGNPTDRPQAITVPQVQQDADEADRLSQACREFVTLRDHSLETRDEMKRLLAALWQELPALALLAAAHSHDHGKVHEIFQEMLLAGVAPTDPLHIDGPWAKSDGRSRAYCSRRAFRHELASALAILQRGGDELSAYLAATHHGKVRTVIRSRTTEAAAPNGRRFAHGIWDGDVLPTTDLGDGLVIEAVELDLRLMELGGGGGRSWTALVLDLIDQWGMFRLAMLETLVRVADWRSSEKRQNNEVTDA